MKTSSKGINLIKKYEGFRSKAYLCPARIWTIGYGHTSGVKSGDVITEAQGEEYLRADLKEAENVINSHNLELNQNQFDALVSFVFNLGPGNFNRSTLLKLIKGSRYDVRIKAEFRKWVYGGGKVLNGLVKRRKEEAELYFS